MGKNKFNSILVKESKEALRRDVAERTRDEIKRKFSQDKQEKHVLRDIFGIFTSSIWGILKFAAIILIVIFILILITCAVYPDLRLQLQEQWRMLAERMIAIWSF